jgi:hypothetical protein
MKRSRQLFTLLLALFLYVSGSAQSSDRKVIQEPVKYNDYIVDQQNLIGGKLLELFQVFNNPESSQSEATASLEFVNAAIEQALANLSVLSPIEDLGVKQAATDLFLFYRQTMQSKYPLLINQVYSSAPDVEEINRIMAEITNEEKGLDEAFLGAQEKFAAANNFKLEENELQKEIGGE